jgi:Leucine-rich repeat (LRR) protein
MKNRILILLMLPLFLVGQNTYVPDDNFEQALINLNLDGMFDDSVLTSAIDTLTILYLSNRNIADLTGIEDFTQLSELYCNDNQLVELDLRYNPNLFELNCRSNMLTSLDVRNGNNSGLWYFTALNNPSLYCITVDDIANANANWEKDNACTFSSNCGTSSVNDFNKTRTLLKIVDMYGRESKPLPNVPLLYIYDDGSVEKKLIIKN